MAMPRFKPLPPQDPSTLTAYLEELQSGWHCWFEDLPSASHIRSAADPGKAITNLLKINGIAWREFKTQQSRRPNLYEIVIDAIFVPPLLSAPRETPVCPDCKGTGEYRGLLTIEPCRTCCPAG